MERFNSLNGFATAPASPAAPTNKYFTPGNPGTGVPATTPGAWWFHMITEELRKVITDAGLTPDHANLSQLSQAIALLSPAVPTGGVMYFPRDTAPSGYLKANGAAVSRTTYASLFAALVTAAGFTAQTFTGTIAAPGVFTKAGHGFGGGERLRLSTTGALPTGLNNSSDFFVEVIDANTFYLSSSQVPGLGNRVTTTGTQSGTHSYTRSWWGLGDGSTTFNLPDLRGEFVRGWDDARGLDNGRTFGSAQKGTAVVNDCNASGNSPDANWNPAVQQSNPTPQQALERSAIDAMTPNDYGGLMGNAASTANAYAMSSLVGATIAISGVSRPRNVALLACIKY